jgi:TRAP-type C4-dicarboxylate transport system permease large subunit
MRPQRIHRCLIVVAAITKVNYWRLALHILPFLAVQLTTLLLLIFFPEISLMLPRALGFQIN